MKYKTFISTLILFQIFFYAGFLFVSMYMTNSLFTAARERALGDHSLIAFSFAKDLAAVSDRSGSVESSIRPLFDFYTAHYSRQNVFIEITKHTKSLYSTLPNGLANNGGAPSPNSAANVVYINKSGDGTLIFVNGGIPGADDYFLNYAFDISKDIDSLRQTERTMLLVGTLFSVLAAVFLYFMSERVFKPLSLVSDASKKIAAGDYGNKINIRGNDEIAEMAESFNNMAEEIQKYIARMAEASEKKQRFADNFSHEIRTPLTSIYGSAEYLQRTAVDDEEKYKLTDRILSECKHMLATAERMLTLSSLRSAEITMETIDVDELFEDAKESLRLKLVQNKIELHCEHDIASLQGDKTLLKSLLINLSNNAADACENGGHIVWCVSTSANGNVMTVTDDGKGIAADKVDRIIEPFYRIDKAKRRTEGGVGLGLAICAQICACHNAVLSFSSELGSGTTATITFTN